MVEGIVSLLLERLAGFAQDELLKAATAKAEMEKLERRLKAIQPILRDAYNKQFLSKEVKDWVWRLNEVIYDALDVIDLYRIKSRHGAAPHPPSKVLKVLNPISNFAKKIFLHYKTGTKINKINERLKMIDEEKKQYDLHPLMLEESSSLGDNLSILREERQTTSAVTETKIIGREEDEAVVLKWLCEESSSHEDSASVIAIVAMGGVGKTALAKKIYHNSSVQQCFDKCMWVCVAEMPKLFDLFKKILEEVEEKGSFSTQSLTGANALYSKISDQLKNKKFLLVLDDVWELQWWDDLRGLWKDCGSGSKVLITTRQMEVAKAMGLAHLHELKCLNEERSWQVFVNKALRRGESEKDFDGVLKDVGRDIARKCGGLPLALSVVGSMLQQKKRRTSDWQDVLRSPLWNWKGPQNTNKVFASIALSFMSIPFQLKQCLTYCCMYPKDFEMKKADLVRLWVAEGFVLNDEGMPMEVRAESCLNTLVGCSLIQETENGCYTLHDLVHDFALYMREKEYASTDQLESGLVCHHARYISSFGGGCSLAALRGQKKLRGLMCHEVDCLSTYNFAAFMWLRVLDLSRGKFSKLPESIGDLTLLKYINLSRAKVIELPESITRLRELQTLDLSGSDIKRLPSKISMLYSLRHLDISGTTLEYLPSGIGKLTCLQTLSQFVVGSIRIMDKRGSSLSELRELNNLRGRLSIEHLERVSRLEEVDHAQLRRKENLHELELFCHSAIGFNEAVIDKVEQVYERIEPPIGIENIKICSYPGRKCPTWMSSIRYSCLRNIFLGDCKFLESLPNFGFLPNLVDLGLFQVNKVKLFDSSTFDHVVGKISFPKLESLCWHFLESLEEWQFEEEVENMPSLRQLRIVNCPKLRAMPLFSALKELTIKNMDEWEGWSVTNDRIMPCLIEMRIFSCEKLKLLPVCPKLENLFIDSCDELVELPHYPALVTARITNCHMVSCPWFATSELEELRHLDIVGCPKLESLLQGIQDGKLETLVIEDCPSLTSIPAASGLKSLSLKNLPQLHSLPMTFSSRGLKGLCLGNLPQIKSLPMTFLDGMKRLELLDLGPELGFYMVEGILARLGITRLRSLTLRGFHDLAGVDWLKGRIGSMVQLEELVIEDCPKLLMSIIDVLKEDSLPKLKFLKLSSLVHSHPTRWAEENLTCILIIDSWQMSDKLAGLVRLSSRVRGLAVKVLPGLNSLPEWIQQFHQLEWLKVYGSPHLTCLPHWLSNLSQVERLVLEDLPELVEVPAAAIQGLEGLHSLWIFDCPKLSSLPDELSTLPRLGSLTISGCALLAEWCQREDRCNTQFYF